MKGLERVLALSATHADRVDEHEPRRRQVRPRTATPTRARPIIDNLRSVGIATAIASGNDGFSDGVSFPGVHLVRRSRSARRRRPTRCRRSRTRARWSSCWRPGSSITSSVPGGALRVVRRHLDGDAARRRRVGGHEGDHARRVREHGAVGAPDHGQADHRHRQRGRQAAHPRAERLDEAARHGLQGPVPASSSRAATSRPTASASPPARARPAAGTITISGIPAGAVVQHSALYWMTIGGPDASAVFQGAQPHGARSSAPRVTAAGTSTSSARTGSTVTCSRPAW